MDNMSPALSIDNNNLAKGSNHQPQPSDSLNIPKIIINKNNSKTDIKNSTIDNNNKLDNKIDIKREDDQIDEFLARIVRDYNHSREGFNDGVGRFGSDGEQRETSSDDSVSDELEALTIDRELPTVESKNYQTNEDQARALTMIPEENNEAIENSEINNNPLPLIKKSDEENETDVEDLGEILLGVVKSARMMELEYFIKPQGNKINDITNDESTADMSSGLEDILRNSATTSVDNLFDDQGWVVTDEDIAPSPNFSTGSGIDPFQHVNKTDEHNSFSSEGEETNSDKNFMAKNDSSDLNDVVHNCENGENDFERIIVEKKILEGSGNNFEATCSNENSPKVDKKMENGIGRLMKGAEDEDEDIKRMMIPMPMVTTVFCVSVLCYGVLTNLFL